MDQPKLYFVKTSKNATTPTRGSPLSAGYDLYSADHVKIRAGEGELIHTDLKIAIPPGHYGRIAPRSGLARKHQIDVGGGVIDEDYRGYLCVLLFNHGKEEFVVRPKDRIAQLICEKISYPELVEVEKLDETVRGDSGFGSTGT